LRTLRYRLVLIEVGIRVPVRMVARRLGDAILAVLLSRLDERSLYVNVCEDR
jgi:hypothetical protein